MDIPIKNGGSFHSYVKLPEGNQSDSIDPQIFVRLFAKWSTFGQQAPAVTWQWPWRLARAVPAASWTIH